MYRLKFLVWIPIRKLGFITKEKMISNREIEITKEKMIFNREIETQ